MRILWCSASAAPYPRARLMARAHPLQRFDERCGVARYPRARSSDAIPHAAPSRPSPSSNGVALAAARCAGSVVGPPVGQVTVPIIALKWADGCPAPLPGMTAGTCTRAFGLGSTGTMFVVVTSTPCSAR